jgi:glyoxylase-like metal-dependent hydrolase (beta-lactamase superfamily II)
MSIKIFSIEGNRQKLDGGAMFGHVPRVLWEKWVYPDERGCIDLSCRCLLVQLDDKLILCETGVGAFFDPKLASRYGVEDVSSNKLIENLKILGFDPEDIDIIILSHLHFDHAGGLLSTYKETVSSGKMQIVFPNAKFIVSKEAFKRAKYPHVRDRVSFIPELPSLLEKSGRLQLIGEENEIDSHIQFFVSNGHTPGQLLTLIKGERSNVLFCGDLVPGRFWLHLPITMGYDRYPEKLVDEKDDILTRAFKEGWYLFFTHDPTCAMCKVIKDEKSRLCASETKQKVIEFKL